MEITLTNPVGTKVIPQMCKNGMKLACCKKAECIMKDLYWANSQITGKPIMISKQSDGSFWSHHKDCFDPNAFKKK